MKLEGLIAAVHTPLHDDCTVNYKQVPALAAHLANQQVCGVFVGGTTGESQSLTTSERMKLFNAWGIAAKDNGQTFIAHVGHNSLPDAQALVRAAHDSGADAISAMAPTFFKPADAEALCDWFVELTRPAPGMPFYFYDIPPMSGVTINTQEFLELAEERLPALAGIKYSNPDDKLLQSCVRHNGGSANILYGIDERYLHGLSEGCPGAVGSTFNFAAPLYRRINAAFERGAIDAAESEQDRSAKMIRMFKERDYIPTAKAVMTLAGLDCGPVRPPLMHLSPAQVDTLRRDLDAMGFFDWAVD
ncbi:MAG: dihydrodipicolinate synthase family protein [Verrucomicrobiota bacterium]|nr:dihydrodipicolinate synthase family protein [Verrucomicrobiota bacterium]MDP7048901.1 dihydrodipicolinate synthase family protein [Verrucomicrobiota bacterium]